LSSHRLTALHNRHRGERCVILANGPSLNAIDLSFLRHEVVIGMNKIFLGFDKMRFYPKYYVAVNLKVIEQSARQISQLNCLCFIDSRARDARLLKDSPMTEFILEDCTSHFSQDLRCGYHQGHTVTHAALQVAYHLGFSTVVLLGLDHRYQFQGQPGVDSVLNGPDPNHFAPNYFGYGQRWDHPDLQGSERFYKVAREAYENDGRQIIDATPRGACPVFSKADYRGIFGV